MPERTYTVVAAYTDPPSIFCTSVEAKNPAEAVEFAWEECADANWGEDYDHIKQDEEWSDVMVIAGNVEVVG